MQASIQVLFKHHGEYQVPGGPYNYFSGVRLGLFPASNTHATNIRPRAAGKDCLSSSFFFLSFSSAFEVFYTNVSLSNAFEDIIESLNKRLPLLLDPPPSSSPRPALGRQLAI